MRVHFKPKTTLGKWSAWLIVAYAVVLVAGALQDRNGLVGGMFAVPLGMAAFITGLISIVRSKERSIAVYLVVVFGFITIALIVRLITFPH